MKKRLFAVILAMAMIFCAIPFAAATETPYYEWKQSDAQWASVTLGRRTMKQVGCLATSVAILAVQAGLKSEKNFDPGVFASAMKKAGGFDSNDDLIWSAIPKAVPGLQAVNAWASLSGTQAEKTAKLKRWQEQGYQVAVAVKNGGHWVALRTVADGKAVMMDPGSTATDLFGKYAASGVTRAALLRAEATTKPPATTQPKEGITLESVLAFLKDMGVLLLDILKYFYTLMK